MQPIHRRAFILFTAIAALAPLAGGWAGDKKTPDKVEYFHGNVVPLADIVAKTKTKIDAEAAAYFLVLKTEDGKLYPLLKDEGARMFFKDAKLLNRPMRLTARPIPGSSILQVTNVHSMVKGKLHDVYYWCDVCVIKRYEAGICDCCGEPMDFREEPAKAE